MVAVVKFLSARRLALRGSSEKIGDVRNGNFLGCLELVAEFDPLLATHITKYSNPGSGNVSYLSKTIYEEFVGLMGDAVLEFIKNEIKAVKFYSIVVDSTPDVSHCDQLAIIIRYLNDDQPVERFIKYIPAVGHKAKEMEEAVLKTINDLDIRIENCRGQSYDNYLKYVGHI